MLQKQGNIWDFHDQGKWIAITTNGTVTSFGRAVLGKGVALQARQRYPWLPKHLAARLRETGNRPQAFSNIKLVTFPVKRDWWERADLQLIEKSCDWLYRLREQAGIQEQYMVRPGCGAGGLKWEQVEPILSKQLDDKFVVVYQ